MKLAQKILNDFEAKQLYESRLQSLTLALEHETYKNIPGTKNSYRQDSPNTNTKTQRHSHVYAKPKGKGKELYSVNIDGSGHDGYSGTVIPSTHADFFRGKGYTIPVNLTLESLDFLDINSSIYEICILEEAI